VPISEYLPQFFTYFCSIYLEALPFIVLGAVLAGILEELSARQAFAFMGAVGVVLLGLVFSPFRWFETLGPALLAALVTLVVLLRARPLVEWTLTFLGQHRILAIAMSGLLGLFMPMCECGIIVVMRRLLRKGMPVSCCVSYMLAGPIINVVVMLSTYVAFQGRESVPTSAGQLGGLGMMGMRMGMGFLVAFGTGLMVEWLYRRHGKALLAPVAQADEARAGSESLNYDYSPSAGQGLGRRLDNISQTALHDFIDIMVFLIAGAALAAISRLALPQQEVEALSRNQPVLAIVVMMGLAILLCLCSEADAFVAASFVSLRPASKLAFLVLGPMLDLKLYMMYTRVFRPRLMWAIFSAVAVQVFVYSLLFHYYWEYWRFALARLIGTSAE
jgi:uncharacterized membrane protein YraQ (UPF0718 family)